MKNTIISILFPILLLGCNNKVDENEIIPDELCRKLTPSETSILSELKTFILPLAATKGSEENGFFNKINDIDKYDLSTLSILELDQEKFYSNPKPERILECLIPPKGYIVFIAKKNNEFNFRLEAECVNDKWKPNSIYYGWGGFKCLDKIKQLKTDKENYQLFRFQQMEIITYKTDNKNQYMFTNGRTIDENKLCEFITDIIAYNKNSNKDILNVKNL